MSRVTLYKRCIFQKDYREVMHHSVLETYLNSLEKQEVTTSGGVFMRLNDRINLPIEKREFNYMKVVNDNGFTFYSFIDDMEIHNDTIDVSYTLDVWNTFIDKCSIINGLLTRTLWFNSEQEHYLPIEMEGNGNLVYDVEIYTFRVLLYTIQYYKLNEAGEPTERQIATVVRYEGVLIAEEPPFTDTSKIISGQSSQNFLIIDESESYYYDIIDIHVIPLRWLQGKISGSVGTCEINGYDAVIMNAYPFLNAREIDLYTGEIEYNTIEDYAKKYVGPLDKLIEVKTNGLKNTFKIFMSYSGTLYHFFISVNNKLVEISDSLRLNIPYTSITGETSALRELSAELSYQQGKAQQLSGAYNLGFNLINGIIGTAFGNIGGISHSFSSLSSNVSDIVLGTTKSEQAYAEKYSTLSPSSDMKSLAFLTSFYLENPTSISVSNMKEIKSALVDTGFKVKYLVQGLPGDDQEEIITKYTEDFNVVRYGSLTIVGDCPHKYTEDIKRILESGTRIWYTSTPGEIRITNE